MSICFLLPIAFKAYQTQYRSKYSIRFTQRLIEGKNFEFSAILNFFFRGGSKYGMSTLRHLQFTIGDSLQCQTL